jgi:hypothetical protein
MCEHVRDRQGETLVAEVKAGVINSHRRFAHQAMGNDDAGLTG